VILVQSKPCNCNQQYLFSQNTFEASCHVQPARLEEELFSLLCSMGFSSGDEVVDATLLLAANGYADFSRQFSTISRNAVLRMSNKGPFQQQWQYAAMVLAANEASTTAGRCLEKGISE
jgi:hypothetical protein